jgi:hypothetical protein
MTIKLYNQNGHGTLLWKWRNSSWPLLTGKVASEISLETNDEAVWRVPKTQEKVLFLKKSKRDYFEGDK